MPSAMTVRTLIVDASNPQDQSDDALGDSGAIVLDASGPPRSCGWRARRRRCRGVLDHRDSARHPKFLLSLAVVFRCGDAMDRREPRPRRHRLRAPRGRYRRYPWDAGQWTAARASMGLLDGKVPYVLAVGNHDLGSTRTDAGVLIPRSTPINNYFSYDDDLPRANLRWRLRKWPCREYLSLAHWGRTNLARHLIGVFAAK
jgi:hypothetical protein